MSFEYIPVPQWPPLTWLAKCRRGNSNVTVFYGSRVETAGEWFCEAVWAGDYESGGFDQTDIVAGSGARLRDGTVVFVSSGSTVDRLHSLQTGDEAWLSNSLSCLLMALGATVSPSYPKYFDDFGSITEGLHKYRRELATSAGPIQLTYFDNLLWDGQSLTVQPKPGKTRDFSTFARYRNFLESSLQRLSENAVVKQRRYPYRILGTVSRGYDSPTVTTLARQAGCVEALSFDRSARGDDDNGEVIARILGVRPLVVKRDAWQSMALPEIPFVASTPAGGDVLFKGAEEHLAGRVLLTGYHGDKVWDTETKDLSAHIVRGDDSGVGLTEYRLWVGFIHCPIAFWGVRQIRDVHALSHSSEMKPWNVGQPSYRRPICRRIVEEAGVPRELFGAHKRGMSVPLHAPGQFLTPASRDDYLGWLREHRREWTQHARIPPLPGVGACFDWGSVLSPGLFPMAVAADKLAHTRLVASKSSSRLDIRPIQRTPVPSSLHVSLGYRTCETPLSASILMDTALDVIVAS